MSGKGKAPAKASKLNARKGAQAKLATEVRALQRQVGTPYRVPTVPRPRIQTAISSSSTSVASPLVRALIDPCTAPPAHVPDEWSGKAQFLKSVTKITLALDAAGNRGIIVTGVPTDLIYLSGAAVYATWLATADTQLTRLSAGDYHSVRPVSYCVQLLSRAAATTV
jgi:hypothetical protein